MAVNIMADIDKSMGIDCLASSRATLKCHLRIVRFEIPKKLSFVLRGDQGVTPSKLIGTKLEDFTIS